MVGRGTSIVRDSLSHSLFIRAIVIHSFVPNLQLIQSLQGIAIAFPIRSLDLFARLIA